MGRRRAVFLDRDGTINVEKEYLHRIEDWEWIPGAIEAIRQINRMGYLAIVVTNQAGVARGYYDEPAVRRLHAQVDRWLADKGAHIDAYYHCPHHPEHGEPGECQCRKPAPGLLQAAQRDFGLDLENCWLIGDKASDVGAALAAGVSPILVLTGYGATERAHVSSAVPRARDILAAVRHIEETTKEAQPQ